MTDRIPCAVPYCRRTLGRDRGYREWICGKHWALLPKRTRRRYSRARRIMRKRIERDATYSTPWKYPAGSPERIAAVKAWRTFDRVWQRIKEQAIERAMGI